MPAEVLAGLPEPAIEAFAGVGNPFSLGEIVQGEAVLDVGSGAGFDSLVAARRVGPTGKVVGVDMTDAMLARAKANASLVGIEHVEFRKGQAEAMPVEDGSIDVVISNGVVNLCPDKLAPSTTECTASFDQAAA